MRDENEILVEAFRQMAPTNGLATVVIKRQKTQSAEIDVNVPLSLPHAIEHVRHTLAATRLVDEFAPGPGVFIVRVLTGGGGLKLNPVLVTVTITGGDTEAGPTTIRVRGAAKEGLIKQRAGEKTAASVANALVQQPPQVWRP